MVFKCTKLSGDSCTIYPDRPEICIHYPTKAMIKRKGKIFEHCGYDVEPLVNFDDILESKL
ncbi:MAG: hypothetical protein GY765_23875 [bacterium]|nr:hypothetical protein [bacterium]